MNQPVVVLSPQVDWPGAFAREAARITHALGDFDHEIHHIGSTAINGVLAKPIIDMLLLVNGLDDLDEQTPRLTNAGYEAKGEYGIPQRRYFRLQSVQGVRTHHLHAFVRGSSGALRHLAFRDYMNEHPAAASAYSELKRQLANRHPNDRASYIAGKDAFIKLHESLAMAWRSAAHGA